MVCAKKIRHVGLFNNFNKKHKAQTKHRPKVYEMSRYMDFMLYKRKTNFLFQNFHFI